MKISLHERPDLGPAVTEIRGYRDDHDKEGVVIGYVYEEEDGWYSKPIKHTRHKRANSEEAIAAVVMDCMQSGGVE